jgi:hypothetical protein
MHFVPEEMYDWTSHSDEHAKGKQVPWRLAIFLHLTDKFYHLGLAVSLMCLAVRYLHELLTMNRKSL